MSATVVINHVRRNFYLDSVALMRLSAAMSKHAGVREVSLMIGTEANKSILADAGLLASEGTRAGANDLIVALATDSARATDAVLAAVLAELDAASTHGAQAAAWRPHSLAGAAQGVPDANLALVSVPGAFAAREARRALAHDMHVMIFSDNVALDEEVALKGEAQAKGLLVMGPDCGTALVGGVPLAFCNAVPRGDVGVIAASGTGLQEFSVILAREGIGLSHGLGVGGRDLSDEVGGISTMMAIDLLEADPATAELALISKPPAPNTAERVLSRLSRCPKPVTVCFIGSQATTLPANTHAGETLHEAALAVLARRGLAPAPFDVQQFGKSVGAHGPRRWVHGLFTGGSLCAEAQTLFRRAGIAFASNAPIPGSGCSTEEPGGHQLIDLGADEYTTGRPHPMLEPSVRAEVLEERLARADVAVILLDLVLGFGAHADPAHAIAEVLNAAGPAQPVVIASVCGTRQDPQGFERQVATLEQAGVQVAPCNAQAAEAVVAIAAKLQ